MSVELANALAKRFIARSDAKARQFPDGGYKPVRQSREPDAATVPWSRDDVLQHLDCDQTYGHYMLDHDSTTKLFAFDIDLETAARVPMSSYPDTGDKWPTEKDMQNWEASFVDADPRALWRDRAYAGRTWMKREFRDLAGNLASLIHKELELECAVAYSGHKGLHVYGFTGRMSAKDARDGAELVMQLMGDWVPKEHRAGTFKHPKYPHMAVEIYPKQDTITSGGFGNLMRLPLGRNLHSPKDPTFFVDLTAPLNVLRPADPLWSLTTGAANPWSLA